MYEGIDFTKVIAVSNRHLSRLPYLAQVERILRLHPKAFLLREKDLGEEEYRKLANEVKELCDQYQVELIPHFYPATAEALGCGAVHLPLWKYRETSDLYGLRVGVSVHAVEEAKEAVGLGASYLTAGHVKKSAMLRKCRFTGSAGSDLTRNRSARHWNRVRQESVSCPG